MWGGTLLAKLWGGGRGRTAGTIKVVDPNRLNWLYITYNTVEELVRVTPKGLTEPAAMKSFRWKDDKTLEVEVRRDETFADGTPLNSATVRKAFDEMMRWRAPHPPGSHFNIDPRTRLEVTGEYSVRFHYPEVDGLALGKLRAMHLMSERFWNEVGFGYSRDGSGEGHW